MARTSSGGSTLAAEAEPWAVPSFAGGVLEEGSPEAIDAAMSERLQEWRTRGRALVAKNHRDFELLLDEAAVSVSQADFEMAAVQAQMAASYAQFFHPGLFASARLDAVLSEISRTLDRARESGKQPSSRSKPRILHIATYAHSIGGHSRLIWRWIEQDPDRVHSLVLTHQFSPVPWQLEDAVSRGGGRIFKLNRIVGGMTRWARELRNLALQSDMVVVHSHTFDVLPFIALAAAAERPPLLIVDTIDHQFWPGSSVADLVVHLRQTGMRLGAKRRAIPEERSAILPTPLDARQRTLSREAAKHQLGLPTDSILLLSVARAVKYHCSSRISFADAHLPALMKNPRALLIAVGPGTSVDWSSTHRQTGGRVISLNESEHTEVLHQACDIYVDSFPFVSNTSLAEAGLYGVPLVTRFPYSRSCEIFGADLSGLEGNIIRTRSIDEYTVTLDRLIKDPAYRNDVGQRTQARLSAVHCEPHWRRQLEAVYLKAIQATHMKREAPTSDDSNEDEPDCFVPFIYESRFLELKASEKRALVEEFHLRYLPLTGRLRRWITISCNGGFRERGPGVSLRYLLPEWLGCRARTVVDFVLRAGAGG